MQSLRKGASLIIAMILTVMVLGVSLSMLPSIVQVNKNIEEGIRGSQLSLTRDSAIEISDSLASTGVNPFTGNETGENYSVLVTLGDRTLRQDVWSTTGCPIPDHNTTVNQLGDGINWANQSDFIEYGEYDPGANNQVSDGISLSLQEKCYPSPNGIEQGLPYYYVYPSPLSNVGVQEPVTASTDCELNVLPNDNTNPMDHPCYWGKLEHGETVRIPINRFGWNLADIGNLKLRLRTECRDGSDNCTDNERVQFNVQLADQLIDDSDVVVDWNLEFEDGSTFGPSVGDFGVSEGLRNVNCSDFEYCRSDYDHSFLTEHRLLPGNYVKQLKSYFDLLNLGVRTIGGFRGISVYGLHYRGFASAESFSQDLLSEKFDNVDTVDFVLSSVSDTVTVEYQLVLDRHIRK